MALYADALVAWLHYVFIFSLIAALVGELSICRHPLSKESMLRLSRFDLFYGISASLLLAVGFIRAADFAKGWEFYSRNHWFWVKLALFGCAAALSIFPTTKFLKWRFAIKRGEVPAPSEAELLSIRRLIHWQLVCLPLIALAAVLMARGV